jgi:hypothetical protein
LRESLCILSKDSACLLEFHATISSTGTCLVEGRWKEEEAIVSLMKEREGEKV